MVRGASVFSKLSAKLLPSLQYFRALAAILVVANTPPACLAPAAISRSAVDADT